MMAKVKMKRFYDDAVYNLYHTEGGGRAYNARPMDRQMERAAKKR